MKKFKKCLIVACVCLVAGLGLSIKTKAAPTSYEVVSTHLLVDFDTDHFIFEGDILPTTLQSSFVNNYGAILVDDEGSYIAGGWFTDLLTSGNEEYFTGMSFNPFIGFTDFVIFYSSDINQTHIYFVVEGVSVVTPDDGYFINFIRSTNSYNCPSCPENPECPDTEVGSFSQFLIDGVGGFLNFEIIPGWSLIGILSVFLAIALVVIILRYFAGG